MSENRLKRRKYFLKEGPQPGLIIKTYTILAFIMLVSGAAFYFLGNKDLTAEFFKSHSLIKSTMQLLLPSIILVNVAGLIAASFLVVNFTHSIAGPIHRLKALSDRIAGGDLMLEVRFRKKDAIHQLSSIINHIVKGLKSHVAKFRDPCRRLKALSTRAESLEKFSKEELVIFKADLVSINMEFQDAINRFKL